jgi:hypothetical protein
MNPQVGFAWGAAAATVAVSLAAVIYVHKHRSPSDKERRRRELVNLRGRVIEGYIIGCENDLIGYSYHWRGVRYETSQYVSGLIDFENGLNDFSGPATVKFLTSHPSNSIVVAENWSGVPGLPRRAVAAATRGY